MRTFFRTNKNTCIEWLSRIRVYLITVALHCGMYTVVVRQTSEILHDMKDANNTQVYILVSDQVNLKSAKNGCLGSEFT